MNIATEKSCLSTPKKTIAPEPDPERVALRRSESVLEPRPCPYCGAQFVPLFQSPKKVSRTCGRPECMVSDRKAQNKVRYYERKGLKQPQLKRTPDYTPGICVICGNSYQPAPRRRTCGEPKCQAELMRRSAARRHVRLQAEIQAERRRNGQFKECVICGKTYVWATPKNKRRTCGAFACQEEHRDRLLQARRELKAVIKPCEDSQPVTAKRHAGASQTDGHRRQPRVEWIPEPPQPKPDAKMRTCLWCGQQFMSAGPGNRKCEACRNKKAATAW